MSRSNAAERALRVAQALGRRALPALWFGCLSAGLWVAPAHAHTPSHGPMIGAVTSDSASVWARWATSGTAYVSYQAVGSTTVIDGPPVAVTAQRDFTARFELSALLPATSYRYTLVFTDETGDAKRNDPAYFRTSPVLAPSLSFVVLADFMNKQRAAKALRTATTPRPAFAMVVGDMDHSDPAREPSTQNYYPVANADTVLDNFRRMRRAMRDPAKPLGADFTKAFIVSKHPLQLQIPLYYIWDDHDFCMNGSESSCPFGEQARQVYNEYFLPPANNGFSLSTPCEHPGDWQAFHYGGLASFFLIDTRSIRDTAGGRFLGDCQKQWLFDELRQSTSPWKFIVSPVTFNPTTKPWDAWGAFAAERDELLAFIRDNAITNVVVISGDIHSGGALDDGRNAGLPEVSVPHANMPDTWVDTYCRLDPNDKRLLLSSPGTWMLGGLTDPNLQGQVVACLGTDYSKKRVGPLGTPPFPLPGANGAGYLKVDLTGTSLTFRVMNADGQLKQGYAADGTPTDMKLELLR